MKPKWNLWLNVLRGEEENYGAPAANVSHFYGMANVCVCPNSTISHLFKSFRRKLKDFRKIQWNTMYTYHSLNDMYLIAYYMYQSLVSFYFTFTRCAPEIYCLLLLMLFLLLEDKQLLNCVLLCRFSSQIQIRYFFFFCFCFGKFFARLFIEIDEINKTN